MTQQERWGQLTAPLLDWYDANRRILPWREEVSAYRTWISEIMLQQTRVTAVLPYFARFLEALPNVEALANVEEERLLKLWEGLGYYSRARNLQKAARQIMEQYGGEFPSQYEELLTLCGVGEYTAGAIASIAFGEAVPAVDGNVLRLVARITGDHREMNDTQVKRSIQSLVGATMSQARPDAYNQALMDLGATVCLPHGAPLCDACPAVSFCLAHATGEEQSLPHKTGKKPRKIVHKTVFLLWQDGKIALKKRPNRGLLAGLWEFPNTDVVLNEQEVSAHLIARGLMPHQWEQQLGAKHIFTHVEWHMTAYSLQVQGTGEADWVWMDAEAFSAVPLPSAFAKFREEALRVWIQEETP